MIRQQPMASVAGKHAPLILLGAQDMPLLKSNISGPEAHCATQVLWVSLDPEVVLMSRRSMVVLIPLPWTLLLYAVSHASQPADGLEKSFADPPPSARPHTWWHWVDGNVTTEGITLDLEAMKAVGIGGAQIFHVGLGLPKGPIVYNSPEWHALIQHAIREAHRLGLEICLHNLCGVVEQWRPVGQARTCNANARYE